MAFVFVYRGADLDGSVPFAWGNTDHIVSISRLEHTNGHHRTLMAEIKLVVLPLARIPLGEFTEHADGQTPADAGWDAFIDGLQPHQPSQ